MPLSSARFSVLHICKIRRIFLPSFSLIFCLGFAGLAPRAWAAATAQFSYAQSTVASSLTGPQGVAVDGSGNLYIAEPSLGVVLKEALSGGNYTQSSFLSGLSDPSGIAIDNRTFNVAMPATMPAGCPVRVAPYNSRVI